MVMAFMNRGKKVPGLRSPLCSENENSGRWKNELLTTPRCLRDQVSGSIALGGAKGLLIGKLGRVS